MSRVRQRSPRNSVDGDDDMSTDREPGAAAALVHERCHTEQGRLLVTQRRPTRWRRRAERRLKRHGEVVEGWKPYIEKLEESATRRPAPSY